MLHRFSVVIGNLINSLLLQHTLFESGEELDDPSCNALYAMPLSARSARNKPQSYRSMCISAACEAKDQHYSMPAYQGSHYFTTKAKAQQQCSLPPIPRAPNDKLTKHSYVLLLLVSHPEKTLEQEREHPHCSNSYQIHHHPPPRQSTQRPPLLRRESLHIKKTLIHNTIRPPESVPPDSRVFRDHHTL